MRRNISIAVISGVLTLLAGCTKPAEEKEGEPVVPVEVTAVRQDSVRRIINADGLVYPKNQAAIVPKITAPVRQFYVNRGDHVQKDQLLATLENRDLAAAVQDAKGAYEQAAAQYRNTASASVPDELVKAQQDVDASKQAMDAAKLVLDSRKQLLEQGALARRLVDEATVNYAQAKSQYETAQKHWESFQKVSGKEEVAGAEAQMQSAKARYEAAQAQLAYSEIHSPIAGVVTDRPLYAGETAAAGAPLITVMDISRVVVRANVPVAQAARLKVGDSAGMAEADAGIELQGKVTVVSPAVDPSNTTVEVWVEAPNPGERLRPGVTAHLSILAETISNAVVIPSAAVLPGETGGTIAMVVDKDSVAHARKIEIGVRDEDKVQILSGLKPGENVVSGGGVGLGDGGKVRVMQPGAKEQDEAGAEDDKK